MNLNTVKELPVIEFLPYHETSPCFALPLLAHPHHKSLRVVQKVDEVLNVISGFSVLEDYIAKDAVPINGPLAKVGENLIHVFVTEKNEAFAGRLQDLDSILREFINRCPTKTAVILQILELVGSSQEKKAMRVKMRNDIVHATGSRAGYAFYERATLRAALWQNLVTAAPSSDLAKRVLTLRSRLHVTIDSTQNLHLDLNALNPDERKQFDLREIASSLLAEFEIAPDKAAYDIVNFDIEPSNILQVGNVSDVLRKISRTGRQEERIAIFADAILQNREVGISALAQYPHDRARVANWAIKEMRSRLTEDNRNRGFYELAIADLIPRLFTYQYPLNRGDLLYYLAKHLGKWPKINQAIQRSLDRTASAAVHRQQGRIQEMLNQGRSVEIRSTDT